MKNTINKEVVVKVKIETIALVGELVAYKHSIMDGVKDVVTEGVAMLNDIESIVGLNTIKVGDCRLFTKEGREEYRTGYMSDGFYASMINKPFTHIEENGIDSCEPLYFYFNNFHLCDMSGARLPRSIVFEYIQARLSNEEYDLLEVLEKFSKLDTNIKAFNRGKGEFKGSYKVVEGNLKDFIEHIPYYNSTEESNKCVTARWCPTVEEWEDFITSFRTDHYGEVVDALKYLLNNK